MRAWTVSVSMGELAGFCVPALVGGLLREGPPLLVLGAMVLAGVVEGAILGWSQARVLRCRLDGFSESRWVGVTAFAAAGAWFVGMLPSTFHEQWSTWPTLLRVLVATLLGTLVLGSIGLTQWFELRRHVPRAARWIFITAVGWGAGLVVFTAVATPLWRPGQATATIVAIGVSGGGLMAVTMAGLTGLGMRHLVAGVATPPDSTLDPLEPVGVSGRGLRPRSRSSVATRSRPSLARSRSSWGPRLGRLPQRRMATATARATGTPSRPDRDRAAVRGQRPDGSRSELVSLGGSTNR